MQWLNYHHLHYFWLVAREGSILRACEKLLASQPPGDAQKQRLVSYGVETEAAALGVAGRVLLEPLSLRELSLDGGNYSRKEDHGEDSDRCWCAECARGAVASAASTRNCWRSRRSSTEIPPLQKTILHGPSALADMGRYRCEGRGSEQESAQEEAAADRGKRRAEGYTEAWLSRGWPAAMTCAFRPGQTLPTENSGESRKHGLDVQHLGSWYAVRSSKPAPVVHLEQFWSVASRPGGACSTRFSNRSSSQHRCRAWKHRPQCHRQWGPP